MDKWEKELRSHNIIKGINVVVNSGELLEKAKGGFYADTTQNRERGIVGLPYGQNAGSLPNKKDLVKKELNTLRKKIEVLRKEGKTEEANKLSAVLKNKIKNLS